MSAMTFPQTPARLPNQRGVSLIELMVGILISSLLMLGMYQIFSASQVTFQMQEGLSRVQENGRFAMDYLQRNVRMAGFMGCGSDVGRISGDRGFVNHLANADGSLPTATGAVYRFQRPIEAYTAGSMTATSDFTAVAASANPPLAGNDVLVLRIFSEETVPVFSSLLSASKRDLSIQVTDSTSPVLAAGTAGAIYAMQNCVAAHVFQATLSGNILLAKGMTAPNVYKDTSTDFCGNGTDGCPWDNKIATTGVFDAKMVVGPVLFNAEIHRAEYLGIYVRNNANSVPSLYVRRFLRGGSATGLAAVGDPEELAEGVERMLLRFGVDTNDDNVIDGYRTAAEVINGVTGDAALDNAWRQVVSVRIGVLASSSARAGVSATVDGSARTYNLMGTTVTPTDATDGRMRQVYETTIALRNRLLN